jgi:disease resistance protein RPM1
LSYYLICCLLYASLFPEDPKISAIHLSHMLISEGFVQDREGMSSLEIAKEYINELVNRGLIQWKEGFDTLHITHYVHDLVQDKGLSKAKEHGILT